MSDFSGLPKSKKEALLSGSLYFFTGEPCRRGHIDRRYAKNSTCISCSNEAKRAAYHADLEKSREKGRAYYHSDIEATHARAKARYHRDVEETRRKSREYNAANRERRRELGHIWYHDNKERAAEINRRSKAKRPETKRASNKRWADQNPDKVRISRKNWAANNRDQIRSTAHLRRARKHSAEGSHSAEDLKRIRAAQRDRCACCRKKLSGKGHLDHIIAIAKGGSNRPSNLQFLCESCNTSKSARDPIDFMQSRGRLL